MTVKGAQRSNVLVQTQGNIVVNVEREPDARHAIRRLLVRSRSMLVSSALVMVVGLCLAEQARLIESRELRSVERIRALQAEIQALSEASALQGSHVDRMAERLDHIEDGVAALPSMIQVMVHQGTSSVVDAMSNLELRPSFQNLYAAASGFQSDADTVPAKLQFVAAAGRPGMEVEPRRHRQPSVRKRIDASAGSQPTDGAAGAVPGQDDDRQLPLSEP